VVGAGLAEGVATLEGCGAGVGVSVLGEGSGVGSGEGVAGAGVAAATRVASEGAEVGTIAVDEDSVGVEMTG